MDLCVVMADVGGVGSINLCVVKAGIGSVGSIDLCVITVGVCGVGIGNISRVDGVNTLVIIFIPSVSLFVIMVAAVAVGAGVSGSLLIAELWLLVLSMLSLLSLEAVGWTRVRPVLLLCPVGQGSKLTLPD